MLALILILYSIYLAKAKFQKRLEYIQQWKNYWLDKN